MQLDIKLGLGGMYGFLILLIQFAYLFIFWGMYGFLILLIQFAYIIYLLGNVELRQNECFLDILVMKP